MINADEVARLCYDRFSQLPRRGKPEPGREWTLLAAVLQVSRCANSDSVEKEVVSMGTGTKCIGKASMSSNGDILNDSHAEVIARRGCVRYLIQELHRAVSGRGSSVFRSADQRGRWTLQPGVSFLLFTSHTPCGDASIIPMTDSQSKPRPPVTSVHGCEEADGGGSVKRKAEELAEGEKPKLPRFEGEEADETKRAGTKPTLQSDPTKTHDDASQAASAFTRDQTEQVHDIHRTGAKCVSGGPADPLHPGVGYHSTGVLRVKPGRGEPTLSLSCSDKLARWGVVGFQGALLSHYLEEALYFSTVVVGKCQYSHEVMHRALISSIDSQLAWDLRGQKTQRTQKEWSRCCDVSDLPAGFSLCSPVLLQSSLEFPFSQNQTDLQHRAGQGRVSPCGAAISWCNVAEQPLDVTANGFKHGVTKKMLGTSKSRSLLCKLELFRSFLSLVAATEPSRLPDTLRSAKLQTYWDYKQASRRYQQAWQQLRTQAFPRWPRSDRNLLLFH